MKRGMTIIELMVTMVILAVVVASFMAFFVTNYRANAKMNALKSLYEGAESVISDFRQLASDSNGYYENLWNNFTEGAIELDTTIHDSIDNSNYRYVIVDSEKVGNNLAAPGSYLRYNLIGNGPYNTSISLEFYLSYHQ